MVLAACMTESPLMSRETPSEASRMEIPTSASGYPATTDSISDFRELELISDVQEVRVPMINKDNEPM
jgi:hypothetical protein